MSTEQQTSCPYCDASFSVSEEQLRSADGMVRCGVCLRVFDARKGEPEFEAPTVSERVPENPLRGLFVLPMQTADMPLPPQPVPRGLGLLLVVLLLALAGQLAWFQSGAGQPPRQMLDITRLVVRAHPEQEGALRLDAILHNASDLAQPYPAMFLYLDNRYGERKAQRLFLPAEYLPGRLIESGQLPAHTRVQVSLALRDPGQGAVNYGVALQPVPSAEN